MKRLLTLLLCASALLAARSQTAQLDSVYEAAEKAADDGNRAEVYRLAERYCALCDTTQPTFRFAKMLAHTAARAAEEGRTADALALGRRVVGVRRAAPDCEPRHVATALNDLAVYHANAGDYDGAVSHCEEALDIFSRHAYKKDPQQSVAMANMAVFLTSRGGHDDFRRAADIGRRALTNLKKGTPDYLNALNNLAVTYALCDDWAKADDIGREVLEQGRKVYRNDRRGYAAMLANHAARLASLHAYRQAADYADEALSISRADGHNHTLAFAKLLVNRAIVSTALEHYDESIALLDEALPLLRDIVGTSHADYVRCLSELSIVHNKKGNSEKAEDYSRQMNDTGNTERPADARYARVLDKQAEVTAASGRYDDAIAIEQSALAVFRQLADHRETAAALNKLAAFNILAGRYDVAVDSAMSAAALLRHHDIEPLLLADVLGTAAMAHYHRAAYDTARTYAEQAVDFYRLLGDTLSSVYAKALANRALYNYACGDTLGAIAMAEEAKVLQLAIMGDDHPDNAAMYYNLARYYDTVNADSTAVCYRRALRLQTRTVRNNFSHRTSAEREVFWNTRAYLFKAAPVLAYRHLDNDSILADAYNARLFTNGLLLNSEINFRQFLHQTGDSLLLARYERLEMLRRDIDAAYSLPPEERAARQAGALAEAARLEKQLVRDCKQFGDFMAGFDDDYRDVARALRPDEVAVELMDLNVEGLGETYMALYLRRGWDVPRCRVLFSRHDLEEAGYGGRRLDEVVSTPAGIDRLYRDARFGRLVWGRLLPELEGVRTVYFAPTGMFHRLAAEYLALDDSTTVADRYECHRLSSTRLVARRAAAPASYVSAAVFGGLRYDLDEAGIRRAHEALKDYEFDRPGALPDDDFAAMADFVPDSLGLRGGVGYLAGTLAEAEAIGELLMQNDVATNMFEGEMGTEAAFKALNGRGQNVLHVATHGFALTGNDAAEAAAFGPALAGFMAGTDPLDRTGLLFSGANYALGGSHLPPGLEDGILTAREISVLDLSGADLVVLSACRTGVGEVRDDGVFGLQRGFKKAGATTLLVSLWSVSDAATMAMMRHFYSGLMAGLSRHAAFSAARAAVRAEGFDRPFYWASFVMLDDL